MFRIVPILLLYCVLLNSYCSAFNVSWGGNQWTNEEEFHRVNKVVERSHSVFSPTVKYYHRVVDPYRQLRITSIDIIDHYNNGFVCNIAKGQMLDKDIIIYFGSAPWRGMNLTVIARGLYLDDKFDFSDRTPKPGRFYVEPDHKYPKPKVPIIGYITNNDRVG